jgi:diguanylate cyclase (GGDEF)-like protein
MTAVAEAGMTGRSIGSQFELKVGAGSLWFELSLSRKAVTTGQQPHVIALLRDITARKMAERSILRLAHFDSLTGLPNRQAFLERVSREIQRADRDGTQLAVLFLDLDGFKHVNDRHGHGAGDQLLQSVADRLRDCVRPSDMMSRVADETPNDVEFARLGGDEFTALVVNLRSPEDALSVARRVLEQMERPFWLEDGEVALTTSIGVANFPVAGKDALTLLKHADAAMYAAKTSGRGRYALYSP